MAYEQTWSAFSINVAPTDATTIQRTAASFQNQLKTFLVANGWTVVQTCDSTQVATGSDVLTDVTSDYVWSAAGVHTWYTLKSPVGIVVGADGSSTGDQSCIWFTADCNSANVYQASFKFHNAAPTGGTTSAAPTSTNVIGWATQQLVKNSIASCTFNFAITNKGAWYSAIAYTTQGYASFFLALWPLADLTVIASSGYSYPYGVIPIYQFNETVYGNVLTGVLQGGFENSGSAVPRGFWIPNTYTLGWKTTGAAATIKTLHVAGYNDTSGISNCELSAYVSTTGDAINGEFYKAPMYVAHYAPSTGYMIGRMSDLWEGGRQPANGSVSPSLVSPEWIKLSAVWVPTNALWSL